MPGVKIQKQYSITQNIFSYKIIQMMSQRTVRHDKVSPSELFAPSFSPSARWPVICCTLYHLQLHHPLNLIFKLFPFIISTLISSRLVNLYRPALGDPGFLRRVR